jgi:hypothetical protein
VAALVGLQRTHVCRHLPHKAVRCRWGEARRRPCELGRALEGRVLRQLGACRRQHVVRAPQAGEGWGLSGRLDGWCRNGVPVEVKVRMRPRFALRLCDYVQMQCYLHMLDGPPLMLLAQAWHRRPEQVRLTYVVRSRRFWRTVLQPALRRAVAAGHA